MSFAVSAVATPRPAKARETHHIPENDTSFRTKKQSNAAPVLLFLLAFFHSAVYAFLVPLWQAPDEPQHVHYVLLVQDVGPSFSYGGMQDLDAERRIVEDLPLREYFKFNDGRPVGDGPPRFQTVWPGSADQVGRPPLFALLAGAVTYPIRGLPIESLTLILRLFSALLFAATVVVIFMTASTIFAENQLAALAPALLVALAPMPSFLGGMVNSDNLANLLAAVAIGFLVYGARRGNTLPVVVGAILFTMLAFFTKRTTVFLIPLMFAVWSLSLPNVPGKWRPALIGSGLSLLVVLGVTIANLAQLEELLGPFGRGYLTNLSVQQELSTLMSADLGFERVSSLVAKNIPLMFSSAVVIYGSLNVRLGPIWYSLAAFVFLTGILGSVLFLFRRLPGMSARERRPWYAMVLAAFFGIVPTVLYSIVYTTDGSVPQGRYLFVVLCPVAILLCAGLNELVPRRLKHQAFWAGLSAVALFDLVSIVTALMPVYYG